MRANFPSWRSYQRFAHTVQRKARYIHDKEIKTFCAQVIRTGKERRRRLKKGTVLFRAQIGEYQGPKSPNDLDNQDQPFPHLPSRMVPLEGSASEGRANPKGISYLYLASDRETAIAESRGVKSDVISVGAFELTRSLSIVDCSVGRSPTFYFEEPSPAKRTEAVWRDIDHAFSRPLTRSDQQADYVPTQILTELFKTHGFDGVAYGSSLADGRNLVLFDVHAAQLTNCCLFRVTKSKLEFEQASNPYVVSDGKIMWNTIESVTRAEA
jgi:RES domain-containing protein